LLQRHSRVVDTMPRPPEDVLQAAICDAMVHAQSEGHTEPKANTEYCVLYLLDRFPDLGASAAVGALWRHSLAMSPVAPAAEKSPVVPAADCASPGVARPQAEDPPQSAEVVPIGCATAAKGSPPTARGETVSIGVSEADENEIATLIKDHSEAICWAPDRAPDWKRYSADFLPGASLFPAARPAQVRAPELFIEQLKGVAAGALNTFEDRTLGMHIVGFGNIAVVLAASEMLENGSETNHDISAYLLVKTEGRWLIAAHAWDKATEELPVPAELRSAFV